MDDVMTGSHHQAPGDKGNELEKAVQAIEGAILSQAPGFVEGTFALQGKKIIRHGGVRHEIDIYVSARLPAGYEATFIFECKNWERKVGKNDIIVFDEKSAATSAQRGFFVAKSFTRDARARAAKSERMTLLLASHVLPVTRIDFPQIQLFNATAVTVNAQFLGFAERSELKRLELKGTPLVIDGTEHDASEYIAAEANRLKDPAMFKAGRDLEEGRAHTTEFSDLQTYEKGRVTLDGKPTRSIEIRGTVEFERVVGSIESIYEVQSRGRYLTVGVQAGGIRLEATLVQVAKSS
jgi:hypothetical protein